MSSAPLPLPAFSRRLRGWKQSIVAELAGVPQTTVSRWERGEIAPAEDMARNVIAALGRSCSGLADTPLRRLIEGSLQPVHLVCDDDHRLLAASPSRLQQWRIAFAELEGRSLWPFASDEVVAAEKGLEAQGWRDDAAPAPISVELAPADRGLRFVAGQMLWERLHLADGTAARLCLQATR